MERYRITQNVKTKRFRIEELKIFAGEGDGGVVSEYFVLPLEKKYSFYYDAVNRIDVLQRTADEATEPWVPVSTQKLKPSSRFDVGPTYRG